MDIPNEGNTVTPEELASLFQHQAPRQQVMVKPNTIYLDFGTQNKSFLDMHIYLKKKGIKNNAFMLMLYDPDLAKINPRDPNLSFQWQQRVLRECMLNYWYFIREIVRIPDQGGSMSGIPYKLHRGNLAFNFCSLLNLNIYEILPRQQFKTISAIVRYLYLFNFGTTFSSIYFLHQVHDKSKENLQHFKNLRAMLPSYLRMDQPIGARGKMIKPPDRMETLGHPSNYNIVKTVPAAKNKVNAANLIRGKTVPLLWFDEYAFIPFNTTVYLNGIPAYKTASMNAARNGKAYGIVITTTPGDLMTAEGEDAFNFRNNCTTFEEYWYDMPFSQIKAQIDKNKRNNFVRIEYNYQQLGLTEQWFESICKEMLYDVDAIKREILLEWNLSIPNAFFSQAQLEEIKRKVHKPIKTLLVFDKYPVDIYEYPEYYGAQPRYTPIIGVDVAGGYMKDYSSFVIVDSHTTRPFAAFKDNSIDPDDLAYIIIELVTKYMPNAVVNVEKTGIGASTVKILKKSKIKDRLYYEIKDRVLEEKFDGVHVIKHKKKTKVYGMDNTGETRPQLIQILRERGRDHKDKFIIEDLYDEFRALEIRPSGRVEANRNFHDDMTFAYLMAMYVWYYGSNIHQWDIDKTTIKTDEDVDEEVYGDDSKYKSIVKEFNQKETIHQHDENSDAHNAMLDLSKAKSKMGVMYHEWENKQYDEDKKALQTILSTPQGREAYARKYNVPDPGELKIQSNYQRNYNLLSAMLYSDQESEEKRLRENFNFNNFFGKISNMFKDHF